MPRPLTQAECEEFLAEPRVGVLSVAAHDGRPPLTVPVWHSYAPGGELHFFTGTGGRTARKSRLIGRSGQISFCVQHAEPPYRYVTIEGTVVGSAQPPAVEQMLAIVRRYLPEHYAQGFVAGELGSPASSVVLYRVRPERWLSMDFGDDAA